MPRLASRIDRIAPFYVMELVKRAAALQAAGRDIVHLSIGEPDFTAIPAVDEALAAAVRAGHTRYTAANGLPMLREVIAAFYEQRFGARIDPARVIVTAGASGALALACTALLEPGAEVLMADPAYPCNRHFVTAAGGQPRLVPTGPAERFQLTAAHVREHWTPRTAGVMVASPSNPTGTSISREALADLVREVRLRDGFAIVDEIYLGLSYDAAPRSAALLGDDLIVVNSFSKYFHMTGWRLGWLIVPPDLVSAFEKLAQNLVICASALAQYAALACFTPDAQAEFERRRLAFQERRDYLLPAFEALGLHVPVRPDGAFYIYADVSAHAADSNALAHRLLDEAGVCAVPGLDFGTAEPGRYMRFSYANSLERLQEAVARMAGFLGR
ncbi:pyridoxal phosphate-dependent aminotransferase [Verticiella sediminum]|uniref:Pyridoxal phosphate-dependent aminotransferase n=1 Tax=Verticiella sediminum TaxID=1247510 RepID=A0A556B075_9BURK|nr:pyridoxal phosphate-dependent aminotransferase [Verticiella sediminum]TSH98574.1 pyridoxal phosphate-dependent aminotransferase [Verticiella sediminum]